MDTFKKICLLMQKNPSVIEYYDDAVLYAKNLLKRDVLAGMKATNIIKTLAKKGFLNPLVLDDDKKQLSNIIYQCLKLETPYSLDSYFQALEYRRPILQQFYLPRRKELLKVVRALEDLLIYDRLDELFMSQPPRTGKTTLVEFAYSWQIGTNPELANLYVSFSGDIATAFYKGAIEIINDEYTYNWRDIFPNVKYDPKTMCNAKMTYLDVGRNKRYHSLTTRSIDGTLNGACDCSGLLTADDLISGIEEATNPARLQSVWQKVANDMLTRAKERAKILWIGTRWSVADPIGKRRKILSETPEFKNRRVKFIDIPALDENDESNFKYDTYPDFKDGFSTEYYKQVRASFDNTGDNASWSAGYMQQPIERSGQLFPADSLMYFNGELPKQPPTKIIAPCDVAWGGGDACCCITMYVYQDPNTPNKRDVYVPAVVFDFGDKTKTQPKIVKMIEKYKISQVRVERNNRGEDYASDINDMLRADGVGALIETKSASTKEAKASRIISRAIDIKTDWHFLSAPNRDKDYLMFMRNLISYSLSGDNKHDDAPDCCAMGCDMLKGTAKPTYEIFNRPF